MNIALKDVTCQHLADCSEVAYQVISAQLGTVRRLKKPMPDAASHSLRRLFFDPDTDTMIYDPGDEPELSEQPND